MTGPPAPGGGAQLACRRLTLPLGAPASSQAMRVAFSAAESGPVGVLGGGILPVSSFVFITCRIEAWPPSAGACVSD